ncbi:MAG TPA: hypothetical protein VGD81_12355 [Opitutaceae bacterium]
MTTTPLRVMIGIGFCALAFLAGGCRSSAKRDYTPTLARFMIEARESEAGEAVTLPQSGVQITVLRKPVVAEFDIVNVEVAQVALGQCLLFQLTSSAARDLYRLTGSNQGRRLVLMLDGAPVGARRIDGAWSDGTILVFAEVPDSELGALVTSLKRTSADIQKEVSRR